MIDMDLDEYEEDELLNMNFFCILEGIVGVVN